ncbi:hemerythrin domain-containing protein [Ferroplasma sp.]|uniref:hemerythrin domain-containing protein n=1 Tax=Ferroplasma sp. TaxID=2591003 RepID=UPI0026107929|nr:hemerythrin domain-containing protein [Ferroplasma sp.]MCL4453255.1 hemerythrin domain-containing protein [Candidatus Thermoplasmatota archaeon]
MDAVELLMMDHSALRIISEHNEFTNMMEFRIFLMDIHVSIEEKVVFPELVSLGNRDTKKIVDSLIADHKLLDKLYSNLIKWKSAENPLYEARIPLFYQTLTFHNSQEEKLVFPLWKKLEPEKAKNDIKTALEIIGSSGIDIYMKETGISNDMIKYIEQ